MSDLSENNTASSKVKESRGRKGGVPVSRIFSVIFFLAALGVFFGGAFFWLRKHQAARDSEEAAKICATPEMLSGGLQAALKDKVEYSFWPPHYVPPMERQDLLRQCLQTAQQYLSATDVVKKSSFVWNSLETLPLMVRHYALSRPEILLSSPTGPRSFTLLEVAGHPSAQLLISFKDSPDMEFCFFKDEKDGSWKLDWQQFARYQPQNWEDFVRGQGEDMGEFRVWMTRERTSETKDDYAYKLIAPGRNGTDDRSIARPMIYVPKKSDMGKSLFMLFRINEEMLHSPYRVLNANDERDALRIRVLLSRSKEPNRKGEYSFTLVKLLGEGWYGIPPSK